MRLVYSPALANPADSLYLTSDITSVLPGASFNTSNSIQQAGYFTWIPGTSDIGLAPISFSITLKEPGIPITFIYSIPMQVRVNKPGSITLNNGLVNLNQDIELEPGMPMNLRFSSVNPALSNAFTITTNVSSVLPGATFATDNASQQTANINFTPTAAQINSQPYTFTVTYQDNAPVPSQYVYTVNVRVRNAGMLSTSKPVSESTSFSAFPNPFSEKVSFKIDRESKAESILIYNLLGQQIEQINILDSNGNQEKVTWENANLFSKGTYIARLVSKDKTVQVLKFIKQ